VRPSCFSAKNTPVVAYCVDKSDAKGITTAQAVTLQSLLAAGGSCDEVRTAGSAIQQDLIVLLAQQLVWTLYCADPQSPGYLSKQGAMGAVYASATALLPLVSAFCRSVPLLS